MFNFLDDDYFEMESTDEGFFRVYNENNGVSACGFSADGAIESMEEEDREWSFCEESFGDFF